MAKKFLVLAGVALSAALCASSSPPRRVMRPDAFLPPNDLKIPVGSLEAQGVSRIQYDAVLDRIQELYGPVIAARGGRLVIKRLWEDATVNASAQRQGKNYVINMYGGLARHAAVTQDGLALVACHELGHHIGGAPLYAGEDWASNEGQADYFANLKCLRRVFASSTASAFTRPAGDESAARAACAQSHARASEQDLCVRSSMAGMSVTNLFRALRREDPQPSFDTPDPAVVTEMFDGHPGTQCRLDTYFAGSLCAREVGDEVSGTDPAPGTCTRSRGDSAGLRPLCWYLPPANEPAGPEALSALRGKPMNESATWAALKGAAIWQGL